MEPRRESGAEGAADFESELEAVCRALGEALEADDLRPFYRAFRDSALPWMGVDHRHEPALVFRRTAETVRRLGALSPAVALAVENHYYVLSAVATLPAPAESELARRRRGLVESIRERRWLVANSNSRVHGERIAKTGTSARRAGERYVISGDAVYMSLATEGDVVVFVTQIEGDEPAIFFCSLEDHPRLEVGDLLFPDAMRDSDTRRVAFRELELGEENLLVSGYGGGVDIVSVIRFELTWHQALLGALSLGTAARAIEEARLFLRTIRQPNGKPLAELDGMVVDVGRLVLAYHASAGALDQAGRALGEACTEPLDPRLLATAFELACAAKYSCTRLAEDVVGAARRIIGARSLAAGHPMERLSKEVPFAQLGGEVHAFIERSVGERVLGERSFLYPAARRKGKQGRALDGLRARGRARKESLRKVEEPRGSQS